MEYNRVKVPDTWTYHSQKDPHTHLTYSYIAVDIRAAQKTTLIFHFDFDNIRPLRESCSMAMTSMTW